MFEKGDKVIIMAYCNMTADEAKEHRPTVVFVTTTIRCRESRSMKNTEK